MGRSRNRRLCQHLYELHIYRVLCENMTTLIESRSTTAILAACERALAKHGYRRMTMEDVANEARITRRTIYHHFPSKDALVGATVLHAIAETRAALEAPLAEGAGLDSLREMLIARILVRLKHVGPYHHSIDEVNRTLFPHSSEEDQTFYEPEVLLLMSAIQKGILDGSIAAVDARLTAELLVRATNGFLPSNLTPAEVANVTLVRSKIESFTDMITNGIAPRKNP
jgi:AcrR family transcriptional regulator